MTVFETRASIAAPLDAVWAFHSDIDGFRALAAPVLGPTVETVSSPSGATTEELVVGTELTFRFTPFGRLPGTNWTVRITDRHYDGETARFRDELIAGPFDHWVHTHTFEARGEETVLFDHIEYSLPDPIPSVFDRLVLPGLSVVFWDRHRRIRHRLEPR